MGRIDMRDPRALSLIAVLASTVPAMPAAATIDSGVIGLKTHWYMYLLSSDGEMFRSDGTLQPPNLDVPGTIGNDLSVTLDDPDTGDRLHFGTTLAVNASSLDTIGLTVSRSFELNLVDPSASAAFVYTSDGYPGDITFAFSTTAAGVLTLAYDTVAAGTMPLVGWSIALYASGEEVFFDGFGNETGSGVIEIPYAADGAYYLVIHDDDFFTTPFLSQFASGPLAYSYSGTTGIGLRFRPTGFHVPEPASWAMLIAGFGLVGAAARRRKPAAA
jgi:hypothetical protein